MSIQKAIYPHFEIKVSTAYIESESNPEAGYHLFAYRIQITNKGPGTAQLLSRHWIITDGRGNIEEVRGPGVVGLQPQIAPDHSFEYESACPLTTSTGSMKGQYFFIGEQGEHFAIDIPEFYLIAPQSLH